MGKKLTSAFFIVLANLVLFVHAVIPHHHHNSDLCFDTFSSEKGYVNYNCETDKEKSHKEESDNDSDHCFLQNIVALSNGEIKQNLKGIINSHDLFKKVSVFSVLKQEKNALSNPDYFLEIVSHNHKLNYFSLACRAFGLRAPPFEC